MTLVPMNVEQLRRQAIKNSQLKEEQQKNYQAKLDQMSKHNVGGYMTLEQLRNQISSKNKKFILIQKK
jgi:hypothetical protein